MRKRNLTILVVICFCVSQLIPTTAIAITWEYCSGETSWDDTVGNSDEDCDVCDEEGTNTQTRSVGSCKCTLLPINCIEGTNYAIARIRTVSNVDESPATIQGCTTVKNANLTALTIALASCLTTGGTLFCGGLYWLGVELTECNFTVCKQDCVMTSWIVILEDDGCI